MKKMYCLVVTDDYSRFTWVFFLATKDETSGILKSFITGIENLVDHKVKVIRCDNKTEFKNREMNQFCEKKGILRQFSASRTLQQNGVAERRNRTLIEAARTKQADSKTPTLSFIKLFGCPVTILNTIDHLGKFDGKADEGFFVGYSLNRSGPDCLFDIDALKRTMTYEPIIVGIQSNGFVGTKASDNAGQARKETEPVKDYILLPLWTTDLPFSQDPKSSHDDGSKPSSDDGKKFDEDPRKHSEINAVGGKTSIELPDDPNMHALEDISIFDFTRNDEDDGVEADMNNLNTTIQVSPNPTTRIHKDHPLDQVIRDLQSATQTRNMSNNLKEHGAWYETLSTYLLDNEFQRGKIDKTLFIKRYKGDILLVQVYVDDIIFGSTKKELCNAFEKLMHEKFQMSSMGELTFFLGLQVQQKKDGIFISQDKYVGEILKKFGFTKVKTTSTPMKTQKPLLKDEDGEEVYQVNPKVLHLYAVKRIFSYFKSETKLGLWYPKDSPFDLVAYTDSDYAGASLDRKSTKGGCQFLGSRLISWQCKKQTVVTNSITEAEYVVASSCYGQDTVKVKTVNGEVQLQALVDGNKIIITESTMRRDLQLEDAEGIDCLPNATIFEQLTLMRYEKISQKLTFYKAFFSTQWKFLIHNILQCLSSKTTAWNEFSSTMASVIIRLATNQKFIFSKYIFESMVKNLDNAGKFLMYLQVFLDNQLEGMPTHNRIYIAPSHTKKILRNMRRVGKVCSRRKTSLFQTMVVQAQAEMGEDNVADEAVNEEINNSLERAATTAPSLDAEQDRGNVNNTQSKETRNEVGSQDSQKLNELMELCTNLQQRVLDLETTKTTQANKIASLKRRVKKLARRNKSRTHGLKRMYRVGSSRRVESSKDEDLGKDASKQGRRINAIDADEDITLVNDQDDTDMFGVNDLDCVEVIVDNVDVVRTAKETVNAAATTTTTTTATITDVEITLAQALA
ncbi:uncharacterized mitochondrial protein-like protein [Tanacetum coccineum]